MPDTMSMRRWSDVADRVRAWWDSSTFLGDVALMFTAVTIANSVMMLTGWDEPKTGTFAYVHLLGRLGIITVVVGAFHVDDARERLAQWREAVSAGRRGPQHARPAAIDAVFGSPRRTPVDITARVFTAGVVASCVLTLAIAGARPPTGGPGLYRNLVVFAAVLLLVTFVGHRWGRRPPHAGPSQS
jgi:hypothetical protein